ncbi:hypothetical protein SUGI_0499910 [Cryptomeria japonica]|nr:hypothetical protein SUGI_0499910 [Cryptomeria japonica]
MIPTIWIEEEYLRRIEEENMIISEYMGNEKFDDLMDSFIEEVVDDDELAYQRRLLMTRLLKEKAMKVETLEVMDIMETEIEIDDEDLGLAKTIKDIGSPDCAKEVKKRGRNQYQSFSTRQGRGRIGIREVEGHLTMGASRGIVVIWNPRIASFLSSYKSPNWVCGRVNNIKSNLKFLLFNIYGPIQSKDKKKTWEEIDQFLTSIPDQICIIGGDFNAIEDSSEKWGGIKKVN